MKSRTVNEERKTPRPRTVAESEETFEIVEQALVDLWKVVDDLWRIRPPQQKYYRVTIFGSSRLSAPSQDYDRVRELATQLAAMGCDIVTGGGPGLMAAANEGAQRGDPQRRARSFGLAIELPEEQEPNPFVEKLYRHRTFFSRLHHFVLLSSAFVVVPGGIGTTLETMMIWQLLQVQHAYETPLVLVGSMWHDLVKWARTHMAAGRPYLANPEEVNIPTCVETVDEAVQVIRAHRERVWQPAP